MTALDKVNCLFYGVEYDQLTIEGDDDYGRDDTIEVSNIHIRNYLCLARAIAKTCKPRDNSKIWTYIIDRVLRHCECEFSTHIQECYYGETLNGIYITCDKLDNVLGLDLVDALRSVIEIEYGYLLDELEDAVFTAMSIDVENIEIPNKNLWIKLNSSYYANSINDYLDKKVPIGICKVVNGKYMLKDGNHRLIAALNKGIEKVYMFVYKS